VKEAGVYEPSPAFLNKVMASLEGKEVKEVYQPLISKKIWWVLAAFFAALLIFLALSPVSDSAVTYNLDFLQKVQIGNVFSHIKFSKILIYGIGFLGLFLIQIPFLKHQFEKLNRL
jgi:hypothetical protein